MKQSLDLTWDWRQLTFILSVSDILRALEVDIWTVFGIVLVTDRLKCGEHLSRQVVSCSDAAIIASWSQANLQRVPIAGGHRYEVG